MMRSATLLLLICFLATCQKGPGEGGGASIQGTVRYELHAPNNDIIGTESAIEEDVYILYGDDTYPGDDVPTDKSGLFLFRYLRKGSYTVYAFADCDTCPSEKRAVELTVDVNNGKETVTGADLLLQKNLDYTDGAAVIKGRVVYQGLPVPFGRIFINYGEEPGPFDDVRSDVDGYFRFDNLIRGKYTVTATNNSQTQPNPKTKTATVTQKGEELDLGDFNL